MKAAAFDFSRASDINELTTLKEGEKFVAGNQSLGPMMNLRLVRANRLVDIATLPALRKANEHSNHVEFGAAVTHAEIEDGETPDPANGWMKKAAANIAHRAVRNRGTIGGSLAHADPAADWVIVLTGLDAKVALIGPDGERKVNIEAFITGPYTTVLKENEFIASVEVPKRPTSACWGYWKFMRQVGEFAKASATVLIDQENGFYRCALGALEGPPLVLARPLDIIEGDLGPKKAVEDALSVRKIASYDMHVAALERALEQAKEGLRL